MDCTGEVQESIAEELLAQQVVMAQCIEQLEACEMGHHMLVSHLRDALHEQESKLEQIRTQLQIAQAQLEQAGSVQQHLMNGSPSLADAIGAPSEDTVLSRDESRYWHHEKQPTRSKDNGNQVVISGLSMPLSTVAESNSQPEYADKSNFQTSAATIAAEVAAKLAASSSSAAMLTSVLSSLAAEEAGGGPQSPSYDVNEGQPVEKRARLDGRLDALHNPDTSYAQHQLSQPTSQYLGSPMLPLPYAYQSALPPPPPMQSQMMIGHHMAVPPQPVPPGYGAHYQPFPPSRTQFYSQPPLPSPPAPAPRQ
jgi:regulator of Ty1 transposition protein 103